MPKKNNIYKYVYNLKKEEKSPEDPLEFIKLKT